MIGILKITLTGFLMSLILVTLSNNKNNLEDKFMELLPGYNCGACGYGSCSGMCEAMKEDIINYKKCKPLRGENLKKMKEFVAKYERGLK